MSRCYAAEVARREKLQLPAELAGRVALHSERNMRRALLSLEAGGGEGTPGGGEGILIVPLCVMRLACLAPCALVSLCETHFLSIPCL